jgi:hypothetical protein
MPAALATTRRHPLWVVPLVAALAVGAFVLWPSTRSNAAPPSNDTCASPTPIALGQSLTGDTTNAANDYSAIVTPTTNPVTHAVPAAGPDVVFKLTLTDDQVSQVTVKAQFQVSLYATPVTDIGTVADCGKAFSSGVSKTFATDGPRLVLPSYAGVIEAHLFSTDWYIVLAGWTPNDKGPFEIGVSLADSFNSFGDNGQAVVGSLLPRFTTWSFSESSTRDQFREFITLESAQTQSVAISYFIDPSSPGAAGVANPTVKIVNLPAGQRVTVIANDPATGGVGPNLDFAVQIQGKCRPLLQPRRGPRCPG